MLSGCLNCPGLDALESFLEELVDDESENISYNVCMYVLHLYPTLSQKDQMTAECAWKTIPGVRGIVGERPHQQLSLCGEWFCVNSSSLLSGHRPPRQSSARSLNSECPSRGSKSCVARVVQVDCLLEVEWCRARKTVKDHQDKQWTQSDGNKLETIVAATEDFIESLVSAVKKLTTHHFIARN
jgi:hypothetical protein